MLPSVPTSEPLRFVEGTFSGGICLTVQMNDMAVRWAAEETSDA